MDNREKKYLFDIQTCIGNIDSYIGDPKLFDTFEKNQMLQDAVERNLEIIGEAINQLLKINPSIPISNARRIVDARNKIIHGYDSLEPVNIWAIVINHLPTLKQEVTGLLNG
ncbi:MAG TPA: antitoxin [Prolixibacteraceae bacterium]|nr:MAG: antitoxin [Bacteroidetes bacterium GWB2_41_8]HCY41159.1 antitoxin [Prolixibacteraceae bacterium]